MLSGHMDSMANNQESKPRISPIADPKSRLQDDPQRCEAKWQCNDPIPKPLNVIQRPVIQLWQLEIEPKGARALGLPRQLLVW